MAAKRFGAISTAKIDNFEATVAPIATDDSAAGYGVGSMWVDVTANIVYICVNDTPSSAIWDEMAVGAPNAAVVTFTPTVLADWDADADPGEVDDALDQLAQRVDDLDDTPSSAYSVTNGTPDRSYDATTTNVDELAQVIAALIADLQAKNILG